MGFVSLHFTVELEEIEHLCFSSGFGISIDKNMEQLEAVIRRKLEL